MTYLGHDAVTVDGTGVDTMHVVIDGHQTGDAEGTSRVELWILPPTGLTVRELVHVETHSDAFGATVDYTEDASYLLERLAPQT